MILTHELDFSVPMYKLCDNQQDMKELKVYSSFIPC